MRRPRTGTLGALAALLLFAARAEATPRARLVYGRSAEGATCPDEEALRRAVAARLGYDPFFPWAPQTAVVTIGGHAGRLAARFELVDEHARTEGARTLEAANGDCVALVDTLALTISIALDPHALARTTTAHEPSADPPAAPPEPSAPEIAPLATPVAAPQPEARDAVPAPAPRPIPGPHVEASVDTRAAVGVEPSLAAGIYVGGALAWKHLTLGLAGGTYLPGGTRDGSGIEVRGWLAAGEVVPCARLLPVHLCIVGTLGRFEGSSVGAPAGRTDTGVFVAAGARGAVDLVQGDRVDLSLTADLLGNISPVGLHVGSAEAWRAPRLLVSLGPSARIAF